ncbi:hypothetical protein DEFDS_P009 (plasmid) [Deferribacter desulfuricans SSM1]|uniref:Uncharacterized protein n=1 Tax=Deferribacter desulfuricans (strain DSM 14783 / JCM 11476 / NBRC 101012 / SSM1) TaxID=639282 RepID=D3PEJ5_DEFDS|nr:hypothetical protein [Deferribacter desulfuricans]BAI81637.1 hypothetical protein DEFDS_P009 [Deferribacter desulfuricans SSM1]
MNIILKRLEKFIKQIGIAKLIFIFVATIVSISLIIAIVTSEQNKSTIKDNGRLILQEKEDSVLKGILLEIQKLKKENQELRNQIQMGYTTKEGQKSPYKVYMYKDKNILAKIISEGDGFVILVDKNNNYYISVNGKLYLMPRRLYIKKVILKTDNYYAIDDLGVYYLLDTTDYKVKYVSVIIDPKTGNLIVLTQDTKNNPVAAKIDNVVFEDGTSYKIKDGKIIKVNPDGTEEVIGEGYIQELPDGTIKIVDSNGNTVLEKKGHVVAKTYSGDTFTSTTDNPVGQITVDGKKYDILKDDKGYYYVDENGNKHYVKDKQLLNNFPINTHAKVASALIEGKKRDIYKDENGYYYLDENGNKKYISEEDLVNNLIPENNKKPVFTVTTSDGKQHKIYKDANGYYYIDENGNKVRLSNDDVKNILKKANNPNSGVKVKVIKDVIDKNSYLLGLINGKVVRIYKDNKGFYYLDGNRKIRLTYSEVQKAINDYLKYMQKAKIMIKLIDGMVYIDKNHNKYFVNNKNYVIKTNKLGDIKNLGKGDLFVINKALYMKEYKTGKFKKLADEGRVELQKTKVYQTADGKLIYKDKDGNLIVYNPKTGKAKVYGKNAELVTDNKGNAYIKKGNKVIELGRVKFVFNKDKSLDNLGTNKPKVVFETEQEETKNNKVVQSFLNTNNANNKANKKKTSDSSNLLTKLKKPKSNNSSNETLAPNNLLAKLKKPSSNKKNRSWNMLNNLESGEVSNTATAPVSIKATLEVTKILGDEQVAEIQQAREQENIYQLTKYSSITFPPGTTFEGYLMNGVIAPTAPGKYSYVFIKISKDTFLQKNIHIGTYNGYIIAKATGDLTSERVMLQPERIVFYDPKKRFDAYYEGDIKIDSAGTVVSMFDGLPGLQGISITNFDELTKWAMESQILKNIGEFLKNMSNPMGAIMTTSSTGETQQLGTLSDATKQGAISGFADTVDMIAQFKLDLMKNQMPVVVAKGGTNDITSKVVIRIPESVTVQRMNILE